MKKERDLYLMIAGGLNLFTAVLHLIGGQIELIHPLLESNLLAQAKYEILGAWHMVSIVLFATAYILLKEGIARSTKYSTDLIKSIGYLYVLFSLPSLIISLWYQMFVPQWILLMPIGIFSLIALNKRIRKAKENVYEGA